MVNAVTFVALLGAVVLANDHKTKTPKPKTHKSKHTKTHHTTTKYHNSTSYLEPTSTLASSVDISSSVTADPKPTSSSIIEVPAFGRCGGEGYAGPTTCGLGYKCVYQNEYYSQCLGIEYPRDAYAQRYEQCRGVIYNGPTDCVPGFTCSIENKYYGGCRPGTASTFLTSTSNTAQSSAATSSVDDSPRVPLYGQCGGVTYNGPTKCVKGATCKFYGEWYSQCIHA